MVREQKKILDGKNRVQKAGGIVFDAKNKKILMVTIDKTNYSLPKGHLEHGESLEDCAKREVYEEVGVKCEVVKPLPPIYYTYEDTGQKVKLNIFLMKPEEADIIPEKGHYGKWFSFNEAMECLTYQSLKEYLQGIRNEIT